MGLGVKVQFDRAAEILSYLVPGVSPMTIWQATREVCEVLQREGQEKRAAVFEDGKAPGGKEVAPELFIEYVLRELARPDFAALIG